MHEHLVALEERMQRLRHAIRQALAQRETARTSNLHAELRRTQQAWEVLCGLSIPLPDLQPGPASPTDPHALGGPPLGD
ncbi:hypothetical protein [Streptomyces hydrogenans]|uniref:hypothetical protein n=1 Tax=Streptomyces hydrogenans TaxID=1873719 RepID=UPI003439EF2B